MSGELHEISLAIGELRADSAMAKIHRQEILDALGAIKDDLAAIKARDNHRRGVIVGLSFLGGGTGTAIAAYVARKLGVTL